MFGCALVGKSSLPGRDFFAGAFARRRSSRALAGHKDVAHNGHVSILSHNEAVEQITSNRESACDFFDVVGVESVRRSLRLDPGRVRRMRTQYCKHFAGHRAALLEIPADVRDALAARLRFHPLELTCRRDSQVDGATKLLFRTDAGMTLESVLLRTGTGRVALCVSTQVGCAAACRFCATGQMGVAHDLTTAEILDQVVQSAELLRSERRRIRNIVLMGMGEPLHNEASVHAALDILTSARFFHHPPTRLLVSTVGVPQAMERLARAFPQVNLALSLHAATQAKREGLIPLARQHTLDELKAAVTACNRLQRRPLMVEYLMLSGVTDGGDDAAALIEWLGGLNVHVNLIPFNSIEDAPHLTGSDRPARDAFAGLLRAAGHTTTIRYSLGADIAAACGQLARKENRQQRARLQSAAGPAGPS